MNTFCLRCGRPLAPQLRFCDGCGAPLSRSQAAQADAAAGSTPPPPPPTYPPAPPPYSQAPPHAPTEQIYVGPPPSAAPSSKTGILIAALAIVLALCAAGLWFVVQHRVTPGKSTIVATAPSPPPAVADPVAPTPAPPPVSGGSPAVPPASPTEKPAPLPRRAGSTPAISRGTKTEHAAVPDTTAQKREPDYPSMPPEKLPAKPVAVPPRPAAVAYSGPSSGFLKYTGEAVPPGGKVIFDSLPPVHVDVAFDDQTWDARFVAIGGKQRLVLTNKTQDMQKKCLIKWNVIQ